MLQELQLQYGSKIIISQNRNQLMRDLGKGAINRAIVYNLADRAFSYIENGLLKDFFRNDQEILELNDAAVGPGPGDQNQGFFFQNAPARPNIFAGPIAQLHAPPVRPRIENAPPLLQIEGRRQ